MTRSSTLGLTIAATASAVFAPTITDASRTSRPTDVKGRCGAEGLARVHDVIDEVDLRSWLEPFARQVRVAESRVVAVGNEVLLRFRPHQHPWRAELDYQRADERPRTLVGGRDGCAGRDGRRQFLDDESELVGSSKQPLQVEETAACVPLAISYDRHGPARHDGLSYTGWVDDHDVRVHRSHDAGSFQAPLATFRPSDGTGRSSQSDDVRR